MKKLFFVLLVLALVVPMGLFAESRLGVNAAYGAVNTTYYAGTGSSDSNKIFAYNRGLHIQLDYDYLFNSHIALNAQADADLSHQCNIGWQSTPSQQYSPKIGYGAKVGVNFYLSFLRLGAGLRYQIMNMGFTGGTMSFKTLLLSMNADLVFNIGEKYGLVIGLDFGYPLSTKLTNRADSGESMTSDLNISKTMFSDGVFLVYGGFQFRF